MEDAGHVGEEEDARCAETDGERRRRLVGVDVQRPARERRDHRHETGVERVDDRLRPRGQRVADEPELGHLLRLEPDLVAGEADRVGPRAAQNAALTASRLFRTTSSAAWVVTRRPPTKRTSRPRRSISSEICGPAPCTTHT